MSSQLITIASGRLTSLCGDHLQEFDIESFHGESAYWSDTRYWWQGEVIIAAELVRLLPDGEYAVFWNFLKEREEIWPLAKVREFEANPNNVMRILRVFTYQEGDYLAYLWGGDAETCVHSGYLLDGTTYPIEITPELEVWDILREGGRLRIGDLKQMGESEAWVIAQMVGGEYNFFSIAELAERRCEIKE